MAKNYVLNLKRDLPDQRDIRYQLPRFVGPLPKVVDLRSYATQPYDQGSLGSCTAQAMAGSLELLQRRQQAERLYMPSRLFIYYNERAGQGTVNRDSGATIRAGIKTLAKEGVCDEKSWPYKISDFKKKPSQGCYKAAKLNTIDAYERVPQTEAAIKSALAEGLPVVFGFSVYDSFTYPMTSKSGVIPYPDKKESLLGGHAVALVGYDDKSRKFLVRNSWGERWGIKGYCLFGYDHILDNQHCFDFWCIRLL